MIVGTLKIYKAYISFKDTSLVPIVQNICCHYNGDFFLDEDYAVCIFAFVDERKVFLEQLDKSWAITVRTSGQ